MKVCVVVPAFNEAKNISRLLEQLQGRGVEPVVIDDGSSDNTSQIARNKGAAVLRNPRNQGKGASLIKGFAYALTKDYDAVITMDADGQHLTDDIGCFISAAAHSDAGIFIGNRMHKTNSMPLMRVWTNRFMSWLISYVAKQDIVDTQCGFRLIKREVLKRLCLKTSKFETESEIILRGAHLGFRIQSVPVKTVYGTEKSQINPVLDTLRFIKFIIREIWTMQD